MGFVDPYPRRSHLSIKVLLVAVPPPDQEPSWQPSLPILGAALAALLNARPCPGPTASASIALWGGEAAPQGE
jgi:hypothetical protein